MHSKAQCPFCANVSSVITGRYEPPAHAESRSRLLTVGTFAEIQQCQDCDVCQFVAEKLSENPARDAYEDRCPVAFWCWSPPNDYLYSFGPLEGETNCLTCDLDHHVLTLADLEHTDLHPDWIDLDTVRAWAKHCDTEHTGICHKLTEWKSTPVPSLAPLLLVDVISKCLVEIPIKRIPHVQYVALSYVWGHLHAILETTQENEKYLRQKHALASSSPWAARLPDTVRDAIELVHRLGIPYLWVDRLCIVQDDFDRKSPQLEQMGAIYANAYLTLVAADGDDANHGLQGSCPGVSAPRVLKSPLLTFSPAGKTLVVEPDFAPRTGPGEWHRRGWTFQERTLSNRNLVFQRGRVFWECRGAVWTEELAYGPQSQPSTSEGSVLLGQASTLHQRTPRNQGAKSSAYSVNLDRWPDLIGYEILVRTYNELLLSFPSDGLRAFTGVINTLSRSFPGGMLYGMPEYFFDYAIIWAPYTPIRRRLVNGRSDPVLPSWSWVGWAGGGFNLSIAPQMHQYVDTTHDIISWENIEIYPKVTWYKTDLKTGAKQAINNDYYEAVKLRKDKSIPLPEGWSRVSVSQEGNMEEIFTHRDLLPGDVFLWPLHIPDRPLDQPTGSFQPYLGFRTSRAFLFVGARLQPAWEDRVWSLAANDVVPVVSVFHLHGHDGSWAGVLISNGAEASLAASREEAFECIVVSGGITWKDANDEQTSLAEWTQVDAIKSLSRYEFYNILCIEWEQGIAYRKAVGRVWKEAWEQLDTSEVDVILG
ncbi:heterokaryon incompatibility protein-domain-containing protein [Xylariaceae sp. AK1471]|nr:heterokaryon incompatibility protein-domain-containing protein [Xylariaceae sp. AK1471]